MLAQTFTDYEIIVVDDGSTDNTRDVLAQYGNRIRYLYQSNSGVSAARNAGIRAARGEWIAFLDSDDEYLPEKLDRQLGSVHTSSPVAVVSNVLLQCPDGTWQRLQDRHDTRADDAVSGDCLIRDLLLGPAFMFPTLVARRTTLLRLGGFDTTMSLHEDLDLELRLAFEGPWVVLPQPLVRIYTDPQGAHLTFQRLRDSLITPTNMVRLLQKVLPDDRVSVRTRRFLRDRLSRARFRLAVELLRKGDVARGRKEALHSVADCWSPRALMRAAMLLLGRGVAVRYFDRRWAAGRKGVFVRSDLAGQTDDRTRAPSTGAR